MSFLTISLLFAAFLLTRISSLRRAAHVLLAQSAMVAFACLVIGLESESVHSYVAAFLAVVIKVGLIPFAIIRIVNRLKNERESRPILSPNQTSLAAALLLALSYGIVDRALPGVSRELLSGALGLILIGILLMITRRQAIMQIVGLATMENGIYLLGLSLTKGFPLVIEMGVFLDILIAVIILVILTGRLKLSFQTTDTTVLRKLRG